MSIKKCNCLKPGHLRNPILQDAHGMGISEQWKLDKRSGLTIMHILD